MRDPAAIGVVPRFLQIYREKRQPQPVLQYDELRTGWGQIEYDHEERTLVPMKRRMPRRAAAQIAWHQAWAAHRTETQE